MPQTKTQLVGNIIGISTGGANFTGIVTASSYRGSGANITGVVTATSFVGSGANITGVVTATSFVGSGAQLTGLNVPAGYNDLDNVLFG